MEKKGGGKCTLTVRVPEKASSHKSAGSVESAVYEGYLRRILSQRGTPHAASFVEGTHAVVELDGHYVFSEPYDFQGFPGLVDVLQTGTTVQGRVALEAKQHMDPLYKKLEKGIRQLFLFSVLHKKLEGEEVAQCVLVVNAGNPSQMRVHASTALPKEVLSVYLSQHMQNYPRHLETFKSRFKILYIPLLGVQTVFLNYFDQLEGDLRQHIETEQELRRRLTAKEKELEEAKLAVVPHRSDTSVKDAVSVAGKRKPIPLPNVHPGQRRKEAP